MQPKAKILSTKWLFKEKTVNKEIQERVLIKQKREKLLSKSDLVRIQQNKSEGKRFIQKSSKSSKMKSTPCKRS